MEVYIARYNLSTNMQQIWICAKLAHHLRNCWQVHLVRKETTFTIHATVPMWDVLYINLYILYICIYLSFEC